MAAITVRELLTKWGFEADTKPIDRLNKSLSDMKSSVKIIGAVAVSTVGTIFGLAASVATAGDEAAKTAKRIGVGVEALQEYQFVAQLAGSSTNEMTSALEGLTFGIAEARKGGGKLIEPLIRLNQLTGKDLLTNLGSAEDTMLGLADTFALITDDAEKASLAQKIFGGSGLAMVNVLNQGSDAIRRQRREARELGVVLSEKATKNSELFIDAMLRVKSVLIGVRNAVGAELLPFITELMDQFRIWVLLNKELIRQKLSSFIKVMIGATRILVEFFKKLFRAIEGLIFVMGGLENAVRIVLGLLILIGGAKLLSGIGNLTVAIGVGLAQAFTVAGRAAILAQAQMLLIPIAIGLAVAALFLVIEDIVGFFQGKKSVFGLLVDNFDMLSDKLTGFVAGITEKVKAVVKTGLTAAIEFLSNLSAEDFAGIGDVILKALELAFLVSTLPLRIGIAIGEGIIEGIIEVIREKFPRIASFLGIDLESIAENEKSGESAATKLLRSSKQQTAEGGFGGGFLGARFRTNAQGAGIGAQAFPGRPGGAVTQIITQTNTISVPISIPEGVSRAEAQGLVRDGVKDALNQTIRETQVATATPVES